MSTSDPRLISPSDPLPHQFASKFADVPNEGSRPDHSAALLYDLYTCQQPTTTRERHKQHIAFGVNLYFQQELWGRAFQCARTSGECPSAGI